YSFQKDLAPVSTLAMVPNVLVINSARTPVKNVAELVALAKKASPELSYGSNGNGTAQHLIGTQFQTTTGVKLLHVPYKGSGPLTTDLLGGQVSMSFDTLTTVLPHIQGGKLKALAVTTAKRSTALPEVPTMEESGLKGFDIGTWFGVLAPVATPKPVLTRLNAEIVRIVNSADFQQRMLAAGAEPMSSTPEAFARRISDETSKFAALVRDGKVTIE
ncbi:MAG: tripartite tricarboxylate transporter substrate binding protein, partial [Cupriavidus sp.]|nr:tripartite tricarboxylate transporter substrate binding protein [Cupriavidus sp.]